MSTQTYRHVLELFKNKKEVDVIAEATCDEYYSYFDIKDYLNYSHDVKINRLRNWFTLRQLSLLKLGLDIISLMIVNVVVSVINFIFIKNIILTYVSFSFLVTTVLVQLALHTISLRSNRWETRGEEFINTKHELNLTNIQKVPMKIIVKQENENPEVLQQLHYYDWIQSELDTHQLSNYNILKTEYEGSLREIIELTKKL